MFIIRTLTLSLSRSHCLFCASPSAFECCLVRDATFFLNRRTNQIDLLNYGADKMASRTFWQTNNHANTVFVVGASVNDLLHWVKNINQTKILRLRIQISRFMFYALHNTKHTHTSAYTCRVRNVIHRQHSSRIHTHTVCGERTYVCMSYTHAHIYTRIYKRRSDASNHFRRFSFEYVVHIFF